VAPQAVLACSRCGMAKLTCPLSCHLAL
jgi:hypothetical protein